MAHQVDWSHDALCFGFRPLAEIARQVGEACFTTDDAQEVRCQKYILHPQQAVYAVQLLFTS